jgi:predicted dehydrogenase
MLNAAIVGLGRWGQNLVNHVQGKSEKIRFVAGVLRHVEKAQEYAQRQGLKLYDDYRKALADPDIDAIVLATPHTLHAEQVIAAAKAGKHVFTEKPLALTKQSAAAAIRACTANNVVLGVGYNWRFQPALQEIRNMLNDGRLGKLLHLEGNFCGPSTYWHSKDHWRQQREEGPAGGMTGRGVHVVDAMLYLAGPVDNVYAQSYRLAHDFGIDDTTSMLLHFRGGATGYLGTCIATAETWRMQIFASKGWVEVGDIEHLTTWSMRVCHIDFEDMHNRQRPQLVTFPDTSTERAELENFADAIAAHRPLAVSGGDEDHGAAVFDAVLQSAKTGRPVSVNRPARASATKKSTPAAKKRVSRGMKKKAAPERKASPARSKRTAASARKK